MHKASYCCRALWPLFLCIGLTATLEGALLERGDVVFVDGVQDSVVLWRASEGRTIILGSLPISGNGGGIAVSEAGEIYGGTNSGGFNPASEFSRFNPLTGIFEPISSERLIGNMGRMIVSRDGQKLIVAGETASGVSALFHLEIATGKQSILTTNFHTLFLDLLPAIELPFALAHAPGSKLIVLDRSYGHVVEFNEDGTGRRLVKEMPFDFLATGLAVSETGEIYVSGLNLPQKVFRVDSTTGATTPAGDGGLVRTPFDLAFVGGKLLAADKPDLIFIDPATSVETVALNWPNATRTIFEYRGAAAEFPRLMIRRRGDAVEISWTPVENGWRLESADIIPQLAPWAIEAELQGGALIELPIHHPQQSFRLARP